MPVDHIVQNWQPGAAPVAVVMISLNEGYNLEAVLENLKGWAQEVFLVDSYSQDDTVDIALRHGVHVVQRRFRGFGDQWNFALRELPITAPWTMKLDPDERLTDQLKASIVDRVAKGDQTGLSFERRLWFMGKSLPISQKLVRIWKTGSCRFTDVSVNEHPLVDGIIVHVEGVLEHRDSPDLHHWVDKQNRYTSLEALARYRNDLFAVNPKILGTPLERRMWFKKNFMSFPLRYQIQFMANLIRVQPWRTGYEGVAWARLRVWVRRMIEDKLREMRATGRDIELTSPMLGQPHPGAFQSRS
ncbi:MAG: glycosyltransferase family 2 protein [Methylococcus sp.]|nr:glycosyltransferase family 2 protein [Methylococcus sp.]